MFFLQLMEKRITAFVFKNETLIFVSTISVLGQPGFYWKMVVVVANTCQGGATAKVSWVKC